MRLFIAVLLLSLTACTLPEPEQPMLDTSCRQAWTIYEDSCVLLDCHRGAIDSRLGFATKEDCEALLTSDAWDSGNETNVTLASVESNEVELRYCEEDSDCIITSKICCCYVPKDAIHKQYKEYYKMHCEGKSCGGGCPALTEAEKNLKAKCQDNACVLRPS